MALLGSAHDGERAAAALKVTEFLQARSMTWNDLIRSRSDKQAKPERAKHWSEGERSEAEWLHALKANVWIFLTEWEQEFVDNVLRRNRWPLTPKQFEVLARLKEKHCRLYT